VKIIISASASAFVRAPPARPGTSPMASQSPRATALRPGGEGQAAAGNPAARLAGRRRWGALGVGTRYAPLPADTEQRMADFSELVATAIANADAQAELTASRARIIATADETRRKIERDLHDGAQQRLVSLALQVRKAQAAVQAEVTPDLRQLGTELKTIATGLSNALEELRELARGLHPAILAEAGLGPALRAIARRTAVPIELNLRINDRLPEPIEIPAYYVVSEALANAAKHAHASRVTVDIEVVDGVLQVSVRDDGIGGADFTGGSGLVGLKDRVEALGGRIELQSELGVGTTLFAKLPLEGNAQEFLNRGLQGLRR